MICFGAAALVGVPLFFLAKASLGTTTAALCMILVMLPFFLFAMYEKNGQPLEVFLGHLIQNKFIRPKVRIYQTNNLYSALVRQSQLEQEVSDCEKRQKDPAKRKLTRAERKQIEAVIRQAKGDGKTHTVQDSIPLQNLFPDGLCRLEGGTFSKTIAFEDVNYRLAGPEDQRSIFESLCDFYNGYDPSIGVQVSLDSRSGGSAADEMFGITRQGNDLDPHPGRGGGHPADAVQAGQQRLCENQVCDPDHRGGEPSAARARFARIETDTLNRFKIMGAAAHVLDGKERLELLYNILHPEGGQFAL